MTKNWIQDSFKAMFRMQELIPELEKRKCKIPDPKFKMVSIKKDWRELDVLEYLVEHTEGKLYLTFNKVGFENHDEAVFFALRFGR